MVYNCWGSSCGPRPGYVEVRCWQLDNTANNPLLPKPTYIPSELCHWGVWCNQADGNIPRVNWTHFCDPPRATYPITNIGSWPTIPTPYSLDIIRDPSTAPLPDYYLDRGFAIACRIVPTSKCLPYIVFHYAYNQLVGTNTIVEIRKNDPATNLPMGIPGDMNIFGKVTVEFTTDLYSYAVPINTILDDIDVPVWIVLYSTDYACSNAYLGVRRLKLRKSDIGAINNVSIFSEANGCTWAIDNTLKNISLLTYKSTSCNGTVVVNDFAFAKLEQPPIYLNENCFVRLADVQGSKVAVGVIYTNPDPIRTWKRVRLSFAYLKPDLRYFTQTIDVFDVSPGQHEAFFEMTDTYFPGKYDQLAVSAAVIQV